MGKRVSGSRTPMLAPSAAAAPAEKKKHAAGVEKWVSKPGGASTTSGKTSAAVELACVPAPREEALRSCAARDLAPGRARGSR